jgi:hypothetical protein
MSGCSLESGAGWKHTAQRPTFGHHDDHLEDIELSVATQPVDRGVAHHEQRQQRDQDLDQGVHHAVARLGEDRPRLQGDVDERYNATHETWHMASSTV